VTIDGAAQVARPGLVAIVPANVRTFDQGPHRRPCHHRGFSDKAWVQV